MNRLISLKHHLGTGLVLILFVAATCITIGMMVITTPASIGPGGVTLWFIGVLVSLTLLFMLILRVQKQQLIAQEKQQKGTFLQLRGALVLSGGVVSILALSSLQTLSLRDVALIALAVTIIELFLYTSSRGSV